MFPVTDVRTNYFIQSAVFANNSHSLSYRIFCADYKCCLYTICPRSFVHFYIDTHCIKNFLYSLFISYGLGEKHSWIWSKTIISISKTDNMISSRHLFTLTVLMLKVFWLTISWYNHVYVYHSTKILYKKYVF